MKHYIVREYLREDGSCPYREWLDTLDISTKARIQARVLRFEEGNLGKCKNVGAGVWEAICDFGPGYRIYFGIEKQTVVLLLLGGDKRTQQRDIQKAQQLWNIELEKNNESKK